jgi:hypothetical protein
LLQSLLDVFLLRVLIKLVVDVGIGVWRQRSSLNDPDF